ncbi:MAG TPA: class I SAM-dependent methyltransferase [Dissulfurispiraceae bacterium]|nr:class I SAM-dependent methyltransferase [Dissulfurispiraceae bacterium]
MDDLSKEYVISFFDTNLMLHGDRPEAVRWTAPGQMQHYQSMLDIGDISGSKVLDFGCGKGDFFAFLRDRGINVSYTGFDINANLVSLAKKKHPGIDFRVFDIDAESLSENYDYIFLCGVFNLRVESLDDTIRHILQKLFTHCSIGLAFNALSVHNPKKDFELNYTSPEELFAFAVRNLSPFVTLRHDRMPYDYTMFIYRELNSPSITAAGL